MESEIFENVFHNNLEFIKNNTRTTKFLNEKVKEKNVEFIQQRITEVEQFYISMEKHGRNFLAEWIVERQKLISKTKSSKLFYSMNVTKSKNIFLMNGTAFHSPFW